MATKSSSIGGPSLRRSFKIDRLEERVELFRLALGIDLRGLEAAIERSVAGLVIEGFGRGNGPSRLTELVRLATRKGIPVLITSRCPAGRVQPVYGGGGGGRDLADAGGIFAGDLKGPKARLLLMVLLSERRDRDADRRDRRRACTLIRRDCRYQSKHIHGGELDGYDPDQEREDRDGGG